MDQTKKCEMFDFVFDDSDSQKLMKMFHSKKFFQSIEAFRFFDVHGA